MKRWLVIGLMFAGCPKDEPQQEFDPNDRLLQKLKAEQERLAKAPKLKEPEPDPLAKIVASDSKPDFLGVPEGVAADLGTTALTLVEVQRSQTVAGAKLSLSTTDRFLRVTLDAAAKKDVTLDLSGAKLENGEHSVGIARDVQRVGHGSPLSVSLRAGSTEKLVLFFEAPDEMIAKGLKIILATDASRVELPLQ